ncbi:ribonuclease R [Caloramator australicus]|uniref:Ribonuclease R n=1 Tax=Caloramator australicus RC3 TaxID=857293 RepID=I7KTD0_9CLOT|nr:ribonuclease R [Caloramator australicus]CCJ32978.1 3'-to-5' exoribonuclease RNase R [Caloramator australicus RC3]
MSKIKESILEFLRRESYRPMSAEELSKAFQIDRKQIGEFFSIIDEMEEEGLIFKTSKEKYGLPEKMNLVIGKLQGHQKGFGFVIPDDEKLMDVFIPAENINGAMHNDRVVARIIKAATPTKTAEGEIIKILKRANTRVVGTFEKNSYFGFVIPDDKRIYQDIFISKSNFNGAKDGDKVIVEVTKWPEKRRNPEGRIIEVLGNKNKPGIDILSIIKKYNLPEEFPKEVEEYANAIPDEIPEKEIKRRRDLRNLRIVTIDGEDAKDLDDAVSIERLPDGKFKLGVHIADVTYYVKEKSPLDKEALKRGTSVYLVDRVIPMLPKKLSNGVCSLNPRVDRLTLSCVMTIDQNGKVVDYEIFESVIKTCERMTYTDVTKILRDNDPDLIKRYDYLYEDFKAMEELCNILNRKRMQRGALDFDFEECKIILDEKGKPVEVKPYERDIANRIIEEFMIVCNETIAEHMFWANIPFVYRIHEDPDYEKIMHFNEFVHNLGYKVKFAKDIHPKMLQEVLESAKGKKEQPIVDMLLLRSLKQARYSPECSGHFGLASKYYCHFTSPIRRYPDLIIHRIIKEYLKGKIDEKRIEKLKAIVEKAAKQSSDMERLADEAERETEDLKKAEYMAERIGEIYTGIISSVTHFGMFVELSNTIEGLVHINSMTDDYYLFDENLYALIGEETRKIYRLGDEVKVKVHRVDIESRNIDFVLVEE